jgi:hypothetical protein
MNKEPLKIRSAIEYSNTTLFKSEPVNNKQISSFLAVFVSKLETGDSNDKFSSSLDAEC